MTITRVIAAVHGADAAGIYREWNPVTHPDPIALAERSMLTLYPSGYGVGGLVREDRGIEICAHIADLIAAGIGTMASYYGKGAARADDCRGVALVLRNLLPRLREAIKERQVRHAAQGR